MSSIDIVYELDIADPGGFDRMKNLPGQVSRLIEDALDDIALAIESDAKLRAGYKTGNLRRNIIRERAGRNSVTGLTQAVVGVARTAPYGIWTHEGTGIFGTYGRAIRPTSGNFLVFSIGGRKIFARSVKGQRANPFMRDAFNNVRGGFAEGRLRKLAHDIGNLS